MHYKEQHTDNQLLESGWLEMQDQLEREMPQRKESDKWVFLLIALLLLACSVWHMQHNHQPISTVAANYATQENIENKVLQSSTRKSVNQSTIDNKKEDRGEPVNQEVQQTKVSTVTQIKDDAKIQNQTVVTNANAQCLKSKEGTSNQIVPVYRRSQQTTPTQPQITRRNKADNAHSTVKRGHTIPESTLAVDDTPKEMLEQLSLISPISLRKYQLPISDKSLPNADADLPEIRNITPFMSIGLLRSFIAEKTGFHIGFGLHHQIQSRPKLSLKYLLSTNYLPSTSSLDFNRDDEATYGVTDAPENEEEGMASDPSEDIITIDPQRDIDTYYQLSASVSGYYRIHHRFSIGLGGSLTYQDFKLSLAEELSLTNDRKIDTYSQFAGIIHLSAPIHLTPRLSLEPYYQYQLTAGDIKANQAGLNLTFSLSR